MTDVCTIGPVSIEFGHLYENNTFTFSNSATSTVASGSTIIQPGQYMEEYGFDLICSYDEALQLKGLIEQGRPIWMNTTSDLSDNNFFQHKGWVILTEMSIEHINNVTTQCSINYIKISDHENEYLTMDYSRGIYDGVNITPTYNIATTSYSLQEDGTDATTNWSTIREYPTSATTSFGTDGSEFDLACANATDGAVESNAWVICDTVKFTPPFTLETVLDYNALPAGYPGALGIMFTPNNYANGERDFQAKSTGDTIEFQWNIASASTTAHIAYVGPGGMVSWKRTGMSYGTTYTEMGLKMIFYADGNLRVYTDLDTTGTYTEVYYGPSGIVNYKNGLYLYLMTKNRDSTSFTGSFQYVNVYNSNADTFDNVVMMPYNASLLTSATGHRHGEDGDLYYYTNPTTELRYTIATADYYKGSVKLLSTNNTATASRQVLSTGIKLTPTTTTLKNGLTQLTFDADQVILSAWDSAAWNEVNRIHYTADIDFIRPLYISPERVVLQINDTKWTMLRSSPMVTVEHPNTVLGYTLRDTYTSGSGSLGASPVADADVVMTADTDYWCTIYDAAADTYQFLIGKKDPCTIKSDSIPLDKPITALGWFLKGASGINAAADLIEQWYKQTRTGISLKQII